MVGLDVALAGRWVRKMSRASSPSPSCSIDRIDTPWSPKTWPPRRARRAVDHVDAQVERATAVVDRGGSGAVARGAPARGAPDRRLRAASMRSPSTALAVGAPPAPWP